MDGSDERTRSNRRKILTAGGGLLVSALAGCSSSGGSNGGTSTTQATTKQTTTQQQTQSTTTTSGKTAPYIVDHDTVVSAETPAKGQGPCSLQSQFLHGQTMVFRVKVIDPTTGNALSDKDLSGVTVNVKNGSAPSLDLKYEGHPPKNPTDHYWVATWTVPKKFPSGPVKYTIDVAGSHPSKTVSFNIPPSSLIVLGGTYNPPKTSGNNSSS